MHGDDRKLQHIPADFLDGNYWVVIVTCKHPFHGRQNTSLPRSSHMDNDSDYFELADVVDEWGQR